DGDVYCADCFYDVADYCAWCGETHWRDDMYWTADHEDVCENCLERHYTRCDGCEDYYRNTHIIEHKKGHYCEDCLPA
ncbi:MAG: hypothetical protein AAFQ07_14945, partial [Chloroflexota bacterium]